MSVASCQARSIGLPSNIVIGAPSKYMLLLKFVEPHLNPDNQLMAALRKEKLPVVPT